MRPAAFSCRLCERSFASPRKLNAIAPLRLSCSASGHRDYLVEYWDEYTPEELDEDLGAALMTLTLFASPQLARAYHQECTGNTSFAQFAGTVLEIFHDAMREYAQVGRAIYQARYEAGDLTPAPVGGRKIGRNDPCPCGSGGKFKKCCVAT